MFARVKKSGLYEYLQIVQNRREGTKTIQRVVATIGRMDQIQQKGEIENLVRSLSRFSEKVLLVLSGKRGRPGGCQEDRSGADLRETLERT